MTTDKTTQQARPELTVQQIHAALVSVCSDNSAPPLDDFVTSKDGQSFIEFARIIERLAALPLQAAQAEPAGWKLVPMTPDKLADKCEAWLQDNPALLNVVDAFEAGYRACEAEALGLYEPTVAAQPEPVAVTTDMLGRLWKGLHTGKIPPAPEQQPTVAVAPSPTAGMTLAQRILHVGGRNNAAGYVEFGSTQAVEALVRQVLRDLPAATAQPEPVAAAEQSPLTDEQIAEACGWKAEMGCKPLPRELRIARAIESALAAAWGVKLAATESLT